jgi:phospholipid/cholesterol/gamma-HCH transport system ATP-binding protein
MTAPRIIVKSIRKGFGGEEVLKGVSLILLPNKVNFIIGRSGGGKSVLLKHLTKLMEPDSGEIFYDNLELGSASKKELRDLRVKMGLLFQEGALFDSLTAGENIAFPPWYHGTMKEKDIRRKTESLLKELAMEGGYDRKVGELSMGEKKRVALARVLIMEPEVLFFDEPTTGLDPILSGMVDELIVDTRKRTGATTVVVSHDLAATMTIADRINLIHEGRVALSGTPEDFGKSKIPAVKEFISGGEASLGWS